MWVVRKILVNEKNINSTDENMLEKKKKIKGLSQCYVCLGKGKYIELLRV